MLMTSSTATRGRGGRGGGGGGGGGEGQVGIGGGGVASTGITGSRLEQQTTPGVGGHRAVAQGSRSWGDLRRKGNPETYGYIDTCTA